MTTAGCRRENREKARAKEGKTGKSQERSEPEKGKKAVRPLRPGTEMSMLLRLYFVFFNYIFNRNGSVSASRISSTYKNRYILY